MVHCERCGSSFSSTRMASVLNCPRCLLRSDVSSPLVPGPPRARARPDTSGPEGALPQVAMGEMPMPEEGLEPPTRGL